MPYSHTFSISTCTHKQFHDIHELVHVGMNDVVLEELIGRVYVCIGHEGMATYTEGKGGTLQSIEDGEEGGGSQLEEEGNEMGRG